VKSIIAFSELKAKAAIKDVARALDLPPSRADAVCKFIPSVPAVSIDEALEDIPEVKDIYDNDPEMKEVIDKAKTLEGLVRQSTVHASGVVIGDKALENYTPLYYNPSTETITTQYEMKIIERVGLLKVDILGLATLTLVTKTLDIIGRTGKDVPDLDNIPLDDKKTFVLLGAGSSRGIFQFESDGMRRLLQQAKPSSIEDLIALNALFRPGPLKNGYTEMWVNRKHGREKTVTIHPIMDEVLKTTYGVIVYQEQVMRLASEMAGFTLSEADSLRKAMGKKKEDVMAAFRTKFVEGAKKKGISENVSSQVYDSMSRFAEYGFNKSHAAAYAVLAYRTAYLKAHFPAAFMAALLSIEEDPKKVVQYLDEARNMRIKVLPPEVNESEKDFTVVNTGVRFGLATVKGLGEKAAEVIIEARKAGKFTDFFDLVERVDTRLVNKQVFETLAKAGGLDSLGIQRNQALAMVQDALTYAGNKQSALARGQGSLFGGAVGEVLRPPVPNLPEWTERQKLEAEKEVLGFYISSHPMTEYADMVKVFVSRSLGELEDLSDGQELLVAGIVESLSVKRSKKSGELWASLTIEDLEGRIEVVAWPSVYAEYQEKLKNDRLVFVKGHAKVEEGGTKLMADEVFTAEEAPAKVFSRVVVSLPEPDEDKVKRIRSIVKSFPGPVELCLEICEDGQKILIQAGNAHRVNPTPELVAKIEEYLGPGTVKRLNAVRRSNGSRASSRRFVPRRR
jgi:DNA polymerase-3 subunit alpha